MPMQVRRTATANNPPTNLAEGQLAVEMASHPPRLWVGVPAAIDVSGRILLAPSGGVIDYSTSEQDTGIKWIDGSVVYQKTVFINQQIPTALPPLSIPHGINNLTYIVAIEYITHFPVSFSLSAYTSNPAWVEFFPAANTPHIIIDPTNIIIAQGVSYTGMTEVYVTLRYTRG